MEEIINIKASYLKTIIDERNEAQAKVKALKEELKKYKLFSKITCDLDENLRNKVWNKVKVTGIEKRFQEDMINEMDSQY